MIMVIINKNMCTSCARFKTINVYLLCLFSQGTFQSSSNYICDDYLVNTFCDRSCAVQPCDINSTDPLHLQWSNINVFVQFVGSRRHRTIFSSPKLTDNFRRSRTITRLVTHNRMPCRNRFEFTSSTLTHPQRTCSIMTY